MKQLAAHSTMLSIATTLVVAMLCCFYSCDTTAESDKIDAVTNRAEIPVLDATQVNTVISDSGVTRYRIKAPRWQIYDKAEPSYWEFTEGIVLEKFNDTLAVEASVQSNYAKYLDKDQLWELDGNVRSVNLQGETFETEQLFWNQRTERIYSDSLIYITRATSRLTGYGFESNQSMTQYVIKRPTGVFPIKE